MIEFWVLFGLVLLGWGIQAAQSRAAAARLWDAVTALQARAEAVQLELARQNTTNRIRTAGMADHIDRIERLERAVKNLSHVRGNVHLAVPGEAPAQPEGTHGPT